MQKPFTSRTVRSGPTPTETSVAPDPMRAPRVRELVARGTIELVPMASLDAAIEQLRPASTISMTCSPAKSIEATLDESARLLAAGHRVIPHISARMVEGDDHLAAIYGRLCELGVREIFVIAGDADQRGRFFDSIDLLDALLELDDGLSRGARQIDHIGFGSYPDTHPLISNDALHAALHHKQDLILGSGRTAHVATQMCFSPHQIRAWLRRERETGLTVPVHLGVPGVVDRTRLLKTGVRLGVGASLRYLAKNRRAVGKLMTQRAYEPDQLLGPLARHLDELGIEGLHLFTFNQVEATEAWRDRVLDR